MHITANINGEVTPGADRDDGARARRLLVAAMERPRRMGVADVAGNLANLGRRYWRVGLAEMRMAASRRAFVAAAARYMPGLSV